MAVATDANPGSAPCFSLLTAANMACVMLGLTPEEALAGITVHAARALGRADRLGTIEAGKQADLVLWDVSSPDELVYYLGFNPRAMVIKRGKSSRSSRLSESRIPPLGRGQIAGISRTTMSGPNPLPREDFEDATYP